ncbi:hypothetical protein SAMN05421810_1129 [Amycolatopsis arida]|uniref:Uncharacterized protein n=1 Tax=Amycolatopsis arida TaxID=587909 RepID=A0A1I6ACH1_9PSEU|nr:hypothetical protein [Amycolatopsis arida]TDX97631.1 hypothetical protein CLV69_102735 [Amycolatopsis arida]SFQ66436.1 hypothetical protein SAMN05421810_1129 [Amycolatopsis arida]
MLLRWLEAAPAGSDERARIIDNLPPHCLHAVIQLASDTARAWYELADQLQRRNPDPDGRMHA